MKSLFGPAGKKAVAKLITPKTLFAFDYDGTLAPYFKHPDAVTTPPEIVALMNELAKDHPVAVVSGRSVKNLKDRLGFKRHFLIGNHGIDGMTASAKTLGVATRMVKDWWKILTRLEKEGFLPEGVTMENKVHSMTFHYRRTTNRALARRKILAAIASLTPAPRIVHGKFVFNLVPAKLPHKGDAVREILRRTKKQNVFFMGDDVTDEDVFRKAPKHWVTVRVGKSSKSAAQYFIPSFREVPRLLRLLVKTARP